MILDQRQNLLILLILGFSLLLFGVALRLTRGRSFPPSLQALLRGKTHYLCVGILVGLCFSSEIEGAGLLQHAQVSLVGLLITWMGLELGIRAEFRELRKVSPRLLFFDATQSAVTFVLTLVIAIFFLPRFSSRLLEGADPLALTTVLSVAASVTATWAHEAGRSPSPGPEAEAPPQVLGNVVSILLLGVISTLFVPHPPIPLAGRLFSESFDALFLSAFIGVGTGILTDMVFRVERSLSGASYLTVALVIASGGLCEALGLPALFAGFTAGAWLINATLRRRDVQSMSTGVSPVVEGIFMIVAGAAIGVRSADSPLNLKGVVYLALLLFLSRAIAKTLGVGLLWRLLRPSRADRAFVGMWQLSQGSLAIAVCMQPLFAPTEGPMQVVTILSGTALAVALSQAAASTFPQSMNAER